MKIVMLSESSTTAINRDHFDQQFAQLAPVAISVLFETKDNECDPEKFSHVLEYFIQEEIITEKEKAQLVKRFSLLQQKPEAYIR